MSNDIENEVAKIQAAKMRYQGLMVLQWLLVIFFGFTCNYMFLLLSFMSIKVIAEIGCNHRGRKEIAIDLITEAAKCGANFAKFQNYIV